MKSATVHAHETSPNKLIDVKRVLEDGDFVTTHSLVARKNSSELDLAVARIFRFEGDKVVEISS